MGYVPKNSYTFSHFIEIMYPFGVYWSHEYIQSSTKAIYNTYKEDIEKNTIIAFVVRGTSGAMIAGAIVNELHHINSSANTCILIVRKDNDTSAHCHSLRGIEDLQEARFIIVDDFIQSGETIKAILKDLDEYFENIFYPKRKSMICSA